MDWRRYEPVNFSFWLKLLFFLFGLFVTDLLRLDHFLSDLNLLLIWSDWYLDQFILRSYLRSKPGQSPVKAASKSTRQKPSSFVDTSWILHRYSMDWVWEKYQLYRSDEWNNGVPIILVLFKIKISQSSIFFPAIFIKGCA